MGLGSINDQFFKDNKQHMYVSLTGKIMTNLNTLSEQLLLTVKKEDDYISLLETLANYSTDDFKNQLAEDKYKIAFWINIYNAFFQILRKDKHLKQPKIYTAKVMSYGWA